MTGGKLESSKLDVIEEDSRRIHRESTWTDKLVRDLANDDETFRQGTSDEKLTPVLVQREKNVRGMWRRDIPGGGQAVSRSLS